MSSGGYVRLHRAIIDSRVWTSLTDKQYKVWSGLLLQVNWSEKTWRCPKCKEDILIKPGSTSKTVRTLADNLDINYMTIYKTIQKLEEMGKVVTTKKGCHNLYTIRNWDVFQSNEEKKTESGNKTVTKCSQDGNKTVTKRSHIEKRKKEKKKECIKRPISDFFKDWQNQSPNQRAVEALQYYYEKGLLTTGEKLTKFSPKDRGLAKQLVESRQGSDVKYIIDAYLASNDEFVSKNAYSFAILPSQIAKIMIAKKKNAVIML